MKTTKMSASVLAMAVVLSGAAEGASILSHGLNNTDAPDYKDSNLTYATVVDPVTAGGVNTYFTTAKTEGTHAARWEGNEILGGNSPAVANILFAFSVAPVGGATLDLDATNAVTWDIIAYTASGNNGAMPVYCKLFIASDSSFTTILAQSSVFSVTAAANGDIQTNTTPSLDYDTSTTDTLYFGFAFGDGSTATSKSGLLDNIQVNGVVAFPAGTVLIVR